MEAAWTGESPILDLAPTTGLPSSDAVQGPRIHLPAGPMDGNGLTAPGVSTWSKQGADQLERSNPVRRALAGLRVLAPAWRGTAGLLPTAGI